jgi:hypothetical protein
MNTPILSRLLDGKKGWIFLILWVITFALYIATGKAGWVIDASGWIYDMKHHSFIDFLNRTQSSSQSFYQLFAFHYFLFYKIWGMNVWLWSLLYITLHAVNAFLAWWICSNIFSDSGIKNGALISLFGALIYTVSPHISEVLVWKACYHYMQCFMFILLGILWVQKFQHEQKIKYAVWAAIVFILSAFTLEIFYLTPFFVLSVAFYYSLALGYDKKVFRKTLLYFFIPQLVMFATYFISLYMAYKFLRPHKTDFNQTILDYLSKFPKYFFHIVLLGRYFSIDTKIKVYTFCKSVSALIVFYSLIGIVFIYVIARFKKLSTTAKAMFLLFAWILVLLAFLLPLSFPEPELLVFFDRYTYFADAFVYTLLVLAISRFVTNKYIAILLFCVYVDLNLYFTIMVNTYWMKSSIINNKLVRELPDPGDKIVLLLNTPENYPGVPMIGAQPDGIFKALHEVYTDTIIKNTLYEVASFNMVAEGDGAHVNVINDSVLHVTLNQYGSWWWYEGHGAKSYETPDYKVNMLKPNYMYELTLKHPIDKYLLLYELGDKWKTVDMNLRNADQWK